MTDPELRAALRQFVAERDWDQFHTPRNLILALVGEVGELAEIAQWKTDMALAELLETLEGRSTIGAELADIAIYVLRLADVMRIDLDQAIREKLEMNASRYPVEAVRGRAVKYTELNDEPNA